MGDTSARIWSKAWLVILLLIGVLKAAPVTEDEVTHPPQTDVEPESRDLLDEDEEDGRSAYVNNQFVPNDPVELEDDEQNAPLYEILQKQMEQVLSSTGPNVPIYEQKQSEDKVKAQRGGQLPPNKPSLFSQYIQNGSELDEEYDDDEDLSDQTYGANENPDASPSTEEEEPPEPGYQAPQLTKPVHNPTSSTTRRPHKRRSTTSLPKTTRLRSSTQPKVITTTPSPLNITTTLTPSTSSSTGKYKHHSKPIPSALNSLPHDPQIHQHKRRIIFKTISTGSQFINSPIGDLMIKFSVGFAKPASGIVAPPTEALRALSNSLLRNIEIQKQKRADKV